MILFHGTTIKRAKQIFADKKLRKNINRFYTYEKNGDGATTDGYIYLSNEITYSLYYAVNHCGVDKSNCVVIFKIDIPENKLLPDFDEIKMQDPTGYTSDRYSDKLKCSLLEYKVCRVAEDILFDNYAVQYFIFDIKSDLYSNDLLALAEKNYCETINEYNEKQKQFIKSIHWEKI